MHINLKYSKKTVTKSNDNLILFCDEKLKIARLKKNLSNSEYTYINELLKNIDKKKNIFEFEINSKKKIFLVVIKKNIQVSDKENLGADFFKRISNSKNNNYLVITDTIDEDNNNFLGHFLHGIKLKSYEFKKYKSKKNNKYISVNISGTKNQPSFKDQLRFKALEEGSFLTRDLVSEPGNVLHPDEYAKRLISLKKDGLKVTIFDKKKIEKVRHAFFAWSGDGKRQRILSSNS